MYSKCIQFFSLCFCLGEKNNCEDETIEFEIDEVVNRKNIEKISCTRLKPASPRWSYQIGMTYSEAHNIGQNAIKTCRPTDEIPHDTAEEDNEFDVTKKRKQKLIDSYPNKKNCERKLVCVGTQTDHDSNQDVDMDQDQAQDDIQPMDTSSGGNSVVEQSWEESIVKEEWIQKMKQWQANKLPIEEIEKNPNIYHWFEYLPIQSMGGSYAKSRFRCQKCHKYGPEFLFHEHLMSALSKEEGVLYDLSKDNRRSILHHHLSPMHKHIISDLKKKEQKRIEYEISGLISDKVELEGTNIHMYLVFTGMTTQMIFCNNCVLFKMCM